MKIFLTFLVFCSGGLYAGEHSVEDLKVSITVPDEWKHNSEDSFGYAITASGKSTSLRIHAKGAEKSDLWATLNQVIQNFEYRSSTTDKEWTELRVIEVVPVKDSQEKKGFRVTTGNVAGKNIRNKILIPNVYHYLFINSDGIPVCVCLYASSGIKDPDEADKFILTTLKIM